MQDLDMVPTRLPKTPVTKQTSQPGVFIKYRPVPLRSIDAPKPVIPQHSSADESDGIVADRKPLVTDKAVVVKPLSGIYCFSSLSSKYTLKKLQ